LQKISGRFDTMQVDSMLLELPKITPQCEFVAVNAAAVADGNHNNTAIHRNKAIWNVWKGLHASSQ
jgi:hypothetical protein